ncbi:hypothetical protein [Endozoicomonas sp.]|uniref:hypothetical protein n=1 Tax=Endozoicomonas sp. TaxID=1892382 RepID=UPI0028883B4D|nr:hypothetical protein [Endozoicomonas sp.]
MEAINFSLASIRHTLVLSLNSGVEESGRIGSLAKKFCRWLVTPAESIFPFCQRIYFNQDNITVFDGRLRGISDDIALLQSSVQTKKSRKTEDSPCPCQGACVDPHNCGYLPEKKAEVIRKGTFRDQIP